MRFAFSVFLMLILQFAVPDLYLQFELVDFDGKFQVIIPKILQKTLIFPLTYRLFLCIIGKL